MLISVKDLFFFLLGNFIFQGSFRLTESLSGKYRDFPYSCIITFLHSSGTFLEVMSQIVN